MDVPSCTFYCAPAHLIEIDTSRRNSMACMSLPSAITHRKNFIQVGIMKVSQCLGGGTKF